jgi:hypothetical protein
MLSGIGTRMRDWFSKNLGDGMLASEPLRHLEELLLAVYANAGNPREVAAFFRHESDGRLHCNVKVYFSPASAVVAREVDAEPCGRPAADGLSLLAGCEDSWITLFPERDR